MKNPQSSGQQPEYPHGQHESSQWWPAGIPQWLTIPGRRDSASWDGHYPVLGLWKWLLLALPCTRGISGEGPSLTVAPALSSLHSQTGFWRQRSWGLGGFKFARGSWSPVLGQITALGIGDVTSSLLSFNNASEVGFSYNSWTRVKSKSHHSLRLEISQRNASLQKHYALQIGFFTRPLNMVTSLSSLAVLLAFIWKGRRDGIALNLTHHRPLTVLRRLCSFSWVFS